MLASVGFVEIKQVTAARIIKDDETQKKREYTVFLMTARKGTV